MAIFEQFLAQQLSRVIDNIVFSLLANVILLFFMLCRVAESPWSEQIQQTVGQ